MVKFFKTIVYVAVFLTVFFVGSVEIYAQQQVDVTWLLSDLTNTELDDSGDWYYQFHGVDFKRALDEDVFLVISERSNAPDADLYVLVKYEAGALTLREIKHPPTIPDSNLNLPSLKPGSYYDAYFSSDPDGLNSVSALHPLTLVPPLKDPNGDNGTGTNTGSGTNTNTGSGGNTNTQNTGGGVVLNDTQQDIVDNGLVPTDCGYNIRTLANADGTGRICGFNDAIRLVQRVIEYIFVLILPIAAIVFAYAGFLFMTSGGNPSRRDAAKKAMINVVLGIVIVMAAWLVVKTVLVALGVDEGFLIYLDI